jgi:ABC-type transport system substrate-binding protein
MWHLGSGALEPDGLSSLERLYGPSIGGANMSRFNLPEFNALYEKILVIPDGDERNALFDKAKRLAVAYLPEKTTVHGVASYMNHPWLIGYRRNAFGPGWYHMVDIDLSRAERQ